jgi:hypothetical protein
MKFRKNLTQKWRRLQRTIVQGTSPLEVRVSPKECISYASLSWKQKNKIVTRETKGSTGKVDKVREHNRKEKEKIYVSAGEWRIIMSAINHGTEVPEGSRREVLMGYQYALHQHKKKLREERDMFARSRDDNTMSGEEYWDDYSGDSEYSRERRGDPKHNRGTTAQKKRGKVLKKYEPTARGGGRRFFTRNTRSSVDSSTGIPTNHAARTRRSAGRHTPSRNTKPRDSGRQDHGKRSRGKIGKIQRRAKGGVQIQSHTKRVQRIIRRRKATEEEGGCKKYNSAGLSK